MIHKWPWCVAVIVMLSHSALASESKPYTILKVDGEAISSKEAEDAWQALFPEGAAPDFEGFDEDIRQNILRGLVSERLLYKEAERAGVPSREIVKRRLRNLEKQIAIEVYVEQLSNSFVTEKSLRQAYDQYVADTKGEEEIRASHILVDSQEKAQEILAKLKTGKDFAQLAKSQSADKGSAARGGDLNYFTKDKMVKEFSDVAFDLKPGEFSKPVKTNFGWHIIKVVDRRPIKLQSFDAMQERLKANIRKQSIDRYVEQLINKAKVTYYAPNGQQKKLKLKR